MPIVLSSLSTRVVLLSLRPSYQKIHISWKVQDTSLTPSSGQALLPSSTANDGMLFRLDRIRD